jgi:diketogulonate reductase-like aldo/keto reductase
MINRREFLAAAGASALFGYPAVASTLNMREIPGRSESLSAVGLGNSVAFKEGAAETTRELLQTYFDRGGRYVDCAGSGAQLVAATARDLGYTEQSFLGVYLSGGEAEQSENAARALLDIAGKEAIDLAHTYPEDGVPNWDQFRRWKDEGLARYIGLARHRPEFYEMMMGVMQTGTMDFLQVNLSPLETDAEERILPMALDKGVAVTINRPFINGEYFSIVRGKELPGWAAEFDCRSWAQFSLKYVLSHPAVTCVLTETANPRHVEDNLGGGVGRLPDEKTRMKMRALIQSFR